MLANIAKWFVMSILKPLLVDGVKALISYVQQQIEKRKRLKENKKKGEAHENSNPVDAGNTFNNLP